MCVLQHTFYKMHQSATESSELNITLSPSTPTLSSGRFSKLIFGVLNFSLLRFGPF